MEGSQLAHSVSSSYEFAVSMYGGLMYQQKKKTNNNKMFTKPKIPLTFLCKSRMQFPQWKLTNAQIKLIQAEKNYHCASDLQI